MLRARPLVLIVEDDARVAAYVERALANAGYQVDHVADGLSALQSARERLPDLVVLDVGLPGLDGLEVTRRLRATSGVPILILTARDGVAERVSGFDAGADDFLAKPFALEELQARVRALLRRSTLNSADARKGTLSYADLDVDLDLREVRRGGRLVKLRHRAFELLAYFVRHPERVLSRRELIEEVWGYEFLGGDTNVVEVTVSHLRQALEAAGEPRVVHTVRPIGYILRYA
jgi:two-component system, OmpR family, response regulator MprA